MMTRSAGRGDVTPRGERTITCRGGGSGRGIAGNGDTGNDGNNCGNDNTGGNPDISAMIAQQLQDLLPTIITLINNGTNNQGNAKGVRWQRWRNNIYLMGGEDGISDRHEKCEINQRVKYAACSLTRKALTWWNTQVQARERTTVVAYTDEFHELAKMVTPEFKRIDRYIYGIVPKIHGMVRATEPSTIQSAILKAGGLTDDVVRNGLLKRSSGKRKESGETGKQEDARSNNKRAMNEKRYVAAGTGKGEYKGLHPKCAKCSYHHQETTPFHTCFNCNQSGHVAKDCQVVAKRVTPVNAINTVNNPRVCYECGSPSHFRNMCPKLNKVPGQVQNNPNQVLAIGGNNFNRGNNGNQSRGRAFTLGAYEAL
ncbi:reverse transcriptase domain-containing protein [Tanacetum coccineum]|uniref:Reverse transcriptase domain-containing protein n=1 Tax=Tanacetum coccineum TaxID=301880 RepID=A0ABQ4XTT6_9ASTR